MSKELNYKQLCLSMLADLFYAAGYCEGLKQPSTYLDDRCSALSEILLEE